jgi:alpha-tubulin suppressor-like RCC1 family protein
MPLTAHADGLSLQVVYPGGSQPETRYPGNVTEYLNRDEATPMALTSDGRVYTPDSGYVPDLSNVTKAYANSSKGFAIKSDGTLWSWGQGYTLGRSHDIDGDGVNDPDSEPGQITGLPTIKDIQIGDDFAIALANDGSVWS